MIGFEDLLNYDEDIFLVTGLDDDDDGSAAAAPPDVAIWKSLETPSYPVRESYDWCPPTPVYFKPHSPLFPPKDFEEVTIVADIKPDEKTADISAKDEKTADISAKDEKISNNVKGPIPPPTAAATLVLVPLQFPTEPINSKKKRKWQNFCNRPSGLEKPPPPVVRVKKEPGEMQKKFKIPKVKKEPLSPPPPVVRVKKEPGEMLRNYKIPKLKRPLSPAVRVKEEPLSPPPAVRVKEEPLSPPPAVRVKKEPGDGNPSEMLKKYKIPKLKRPKLKPVVKVKRKPVVKVEKKNNYFTDPDALILIPDPEDYEYIFEMNDRAFKGFLRYYERMISSYEKYNLEKKKKKKNIFTSYLSL